MNSEYTIVFGKSWLLQHNHKKTSLFCANLINAWTISNMGIKEEREMSKFTSHRNLKFTQATMKDGLFLAIFATNGMCIKRVYFARLSMLIQCVFTFCNILFPFAFIKFASFKNSKCLFKSSMHFTTRIWNRVCIAKLVWCAMQWMFSKWGAYLSYS